MRLSVRGLVSYPAIGYVPVPLAGGCPFPCLATGNAQSLQIFKPGLDTFPLFPNATADFTLYPSIGLLNKILLEYRCQYLRYCLFYHPVCHCRYAKQPHAAIRFGNFHISAALTPQGSVSIGLSPTSQCACRAYKQTEQVYSGLVPEGARRIPDDFRCAF